MSKPKSWFVKQKVLRANIHETKGLLETKYYSTPRALVLLRLFNTSPPPGLPVPQPHRPYPLHSSCNSSQVHWHPSGSPGPLISYPLSSLPRLGFLPTQHFPLVTKHLQANSSFQEFCSAKETYLCSSESSIFFLLLSRPWHKQSEIRHPRPLAQNSYLPGHSHGLGSD